MALPGPALHLCMLNLPWFLDPEAGRGFWAIILGSWAVSQTRRVLLCFPRNHENSLIRDLSLDPQTADSIPSAHPSHPHPPSHLAWRCLEEGEELSGSLMPPLQGPGGISAPSAWPVAIVIADFCALLPFSLTGLVALSLPGFSSCLSGSYWPQRCLRLLDNKQGTEEFLGFHGLN